jgi:hypothetical protein
MRLWCDTHAGAAAVAPGCARPPSAIDQLGLGSQHQTRSGGPKFSAHRAEHVSNSVCSSAATPTGRRRGVALQDGFVVVSLLAAPAGGTGGAPRGARLWRALKERNGFV